MYDIIPPIICLAILRTQLYACLPRIPTLLPISYLQSASGTVINFRTKVGISYAVTGAGSFDGIEVRGV